MSNRVLTSITHAPVLSNLKDTLWVSALGFGVGETQIFGLALEVTQIFVFLDTNMLVYPMQNCGTRDLSQCQDPTPMVLHCSGI